MQAGLLKERITIEQPIISQNVYGANELEWSTFIDTRASVNYTSGNRMTANNEVVWSHQVNFTVRVYHDVNENMRIIWQGRKYRILAIEPDKDKQRQTIRTELINEWCNCGLFQSWQTVEQSGEWEPIEDNHWSIKKRWTSRYARCQAVTEG